MEGLELKAPVAPWVRHSRLLEIMNHSRCKKVFSVVPANIHQEEDKKTRKQQQKRWCTMYVFTRKTKGEHHLLIGMRWKAKR